MYFFGVKIMPDFNYDISEKEITAALQKKGPERDHWDQLLIKAYRAKWFNESVFTPSSGFRFNPLDIRAAPDARKIAEKILANPAAKADSQVDNPQITELQRQLLVRFAPQSAKEIIPLVDEKFVCNSRITCDASYVFELRNPRKVWAINDAFDKLEQALSQAHQINPTKQYSMLSDAKIKQCAKALCKQIRTIPAEGGIALTEDQHRMLMLHSGMSPSDLAKDSHKFTGHYRIPDTEEGVKDALKQMRLVDIMSAVALKPGIQYMLQPLCQTLMDPKLTIPEVAKGAHEAVMQIVNAETPQKMQECSNNFQNLDEASKMAWQRVVNHEAENIFKDTRTQNTKLSKACEDYFKANGCSMPEGLGAAFFQQLPRVNHPQVGAIIANIEAEAAGKPLPNSLEAKDVKSVFTALEARREHAVSKIATHMESKDLQQAGDVYAQLCRDTHLGLVESRMYHQVSSEQPSAAYKAYIAGLAQDIQNKTLYEFPKAEILMADAIVQCQATKNQLPDQVIARVQELVKNLGMGEISQEVAARLFHNMAFDLKTQQIAREIVNEVSDITLPTNVDQGINQAQLDELSFPSGYPVPRFRIAAAQEGQATQDNGMAGPFPVTAKDVPSTPPLAAAAAPVPLRKKGETDPGSGPTVATLTTEQLATTPKVQAIVRKMQGLPAEQDGANKTGTDAVTKVGGVQRR
jgi:hypothetical protein